MKETILLHWVQDDKGIWYVDKANYPSRLSPGEILEYTKSEKAFKEDWDKKLLNRLIAKERKSVNRDFWVLRNDTKYGVYFRPTFGSSNIEDYYTDDPFQALQFANKTLAEACITNAHGTFTHWKAEEAMIAAINTCKPIHVKAQIIVETSED